MIGPYKSQELSFARELLQVHHSRMSEYIYDCIDAIWEAVTFSRLSLSLYPDSQWSSPRLARVVAHQQSIDPYEIFGECPRSVSALFDVPPDSSWSSQEDEERR